MGRYEERINLYGTTQRERLLNRQKQLLSNKLPNSLSYKDILLNGEPSQLVINTGTQPYYKEFESLLGQEINIGDYVEWANSHWLVVTCDSDDEVYRDGKLNQCNWLLKWQNDKGEIIERWAVVNSASKYNDGTNGNKILTLGSDQLSVVIPVDEESIKLKKSQSRKFFIDNNMGDPTVYELTNPGNVVNTYNGHGVTDWIVKETQYNPTADDLKYGVCDYIAPATSPALSESNNTDVDGSPILFTPKITFKGNQELKVGGNYKSITGYFEDSDGVQLSDVGKWEVITIDELLPYIQYTISDNILKIKVTDDEFAIGGKVRIQFSDIKKSISTYINFDIVSGF